MPTYLYPQFDRTAGFLWNVVAEMEYLTGAVCWTSDVSTESGVQTAVHAEVELTVPQKTILDTLMAGGGAYPNIQAVETVFEIDDLWEMFTEIMTRMGLDPARCRLRFGDMVGGKTTKMRLYYNGLLTKQQKDAVLDGYANMIREVV